MPRTGTFGGFYFDPEVFSTYIQDVDPYEARFINSGVLVPSTQITEMIGTKGNVFTVPFYKPLSGTALNNDGETDIVANALSAGKQTGMAYRRMNAWKEQDFTRELSGATPLEDAGRKIGHYWQKTTQSELLGIIKGVMDVTALANHTSDIAVKKASTAVGETNRVSSTAILDCLQSALGDKKDKVRLMVVHSVVYTELQKQQLVMNANSKVDAIVGSVDFGTVLGIPVVVDDYTTVVTNATSALKEYHILFIGEDALLTAPARVDVPVEMVRDALKTGGVDILISRVGRVIHPNGFNLKVNSIAKESPTSTELSTSANWELAFDEKNIHLARLVVNA